MPALQIVALVVCFAVAAMVMALFAALIGLFTATVTIGQADAGRANEPTIGTETLVLEILG